MPNEVELVKRQLNRNRGQQHPQQNKCSHDSFSFWSFSQMASRIYRLTSGIDSSSAANHSGTQKDNGTWMSLCIERLFRFFFMAWLIILNNIYEVKGKLSNG